MADMILLDQQANGIRKIIPAGTTSIFFNNAYLVDITVQVSPVSGGTVAVYYTATERNNWGVDGADALWEPVASTYQFTAQQTIHFLGRISGIKMVVTTQACTVDVLGGGN